MGFPSPGHSPGTVAAPPASSPPKGLRPQKIMRDQACCASICGNRRTQSVKICGLPNERREHLPNAHPSDFPDRTMGFPSPGHSPGTVAAPPASSLPKGLRPQKMLRDQACCASIFGNRRTQSVKICGLPNERREHLPNAHLSEFADRTMGFPPPRAQPGNRCDPAGQFAAEWIGTEQLLGDRRFCVRICGNPRKQSAKICGCPHECSEHTRPFRASRIH